LTIVGYIAYSKYFSEQVPEQETITQKIDNKVNDKLNSRVDDNTVKTVSDKLVDNIPVQNIDPNDVYMINQLGVNKCIKGDTYKVVNNEVHVFGKCHGIFMYKNKIGACYGNNTDTKCGDSLWSTIDGDVNGILSTDRLKLLDTESGVCEGNFGLNNPPTKIWVDKECSGFFQLGPLSGKCSSTGDRVECPIGKTTKINGISQGLWYKPLVLENEILKCVSNNTRQTYGVWEDKIWTSDGCKADFYIGDKKTSCDSSDKTKECVI
jgi:hypothetical protein